VPVYIFPSNWHEDFSLQVRIMRVRGILRVVRFTSVPNASSFESTWKISVGMKTKSNGEVWRTAQLLPAQHLSVCESSSSRKGVS
jgi:hypothetical protein